MNKDARRIALGADRAWVPLTDRQAEAVRALVQHGTVAAAARSLGIGRPALRKHLRLAGNKFLEFAKTIDDAGAA